MIIPDVNILVYACRQDSPMHEHFQSLLMHAFARREQVGLCDVVRIGLLRIVTNAKPWLVPTSLEGALGFIDWISSQPSSLTVAPGPLHADIFRELCVATGAKGNLITDAYLAALSIEHDAVLLSYDYDFAKFPGLRWSRV